MTPEEMTRAAYRLAREHDITPGEAFYAILAGVSGVLGLIVRRAREAGMSVADAVDEVCHGR